MPLSRRASRRGLKALPGSPMHQLITFPVRHEWFALPIAIAQKVVSLTAVGPSSGLILIDDQQVPTLDLERHIYRDVPLPALPAAASREGLPPMPPDAPSDFCPELVDPRHVLIIRQPPTLEPVGLIVSQAPVLRRVPQSAFSPVPPTFLSLSQLRCINAVISIKGHEAPFFMLDLAQVLPSTPTSA